MAKKKSKDIVHELSDGRQIINLVPGHNYEFDDRTLTFVTTLAEVSLKQLNIICVFRDAEGEEKIIRFSQQKVKQS